jgi:hypothetical protein
MGASGGHRVHWFGHASRDDVKWAWFRLHVDHHGRYENGACAGCPYCAAAGMVRAVAA